MFKKAIVFIKKCTAAEKIENIQVFSSTCPVWMLCFLVITGGGYYRVRWPIDITDLRNGQNSQFVMAYQGTSNAFNESYLAKGNLMTLILLKEVHQHFLEETEAVFLE